MPKKMNTVLEYLYRDASNYKQSERIILRGSLSQAKRKAILAKLHEGDGFLPEQVGLESLQSRFGGLDAEDDHPWHELIELRDTDELPTTKHTAEDLYDAFTVVKKWDEKGATEKLFGGFAARLED